MKDEEELIKLREGGSIFWVKEIVCKLRKSMVRLGSWKLFYNGWVESIRVGSVMREDIGNFSKFRYV